MKYLFLMLALNSTAKAEMHTASHYFVEQDGKEHTRVYKVFCADNGQETKCEITGVSFRTGNSAFKCGFSVDEIVPWSNAIRTGGVWSVSRTAGLCGYTNNYQISDTGLAITKIAPKNKVVEICETFEPRTYKAKYVKNPIDIEPSVKGCDKLQIMDIE